MNRKNILITVLLVLVVAQIGVYSSQKDLSKNNNLSSAVFSANFNEGENSWISNIFDNFTDESDVNTNVMDIVNNTDNEIGDINNSSGEMNKTNNSCGITPGEKLYVMGGAETQILLNDVWSTVDGINWVNEKQNNPYTARASAQVLYVDNTFYLFGGIGYNGKTDTIYVSKDAKDWMYYGVLPSLNTKNTSNQFSVAYFNNKFWLVGLDMNSNFSIWNSADAKIWNLNSPGTSWVNNGRNITDKNEASLYVFKSKLWLIEDTIPDIWSTSDGISWTYESSPAVLTNNISPGRREYTIPFVYNNKVWIVGGRTINGISNNKNKDVYSSIDGKNWIQVTNNASFTSKYRLWSLNIGFKNKIWTIGGNSDTFGAVLKDEWYSSDGLNWIKETFNNNPPNILLNRMGATGVVVPGGYTSMHAPDLHILGENGITMLSSKIQNNVTVGKWTLSGDSKTNDTTFSGKISLNSLLIVGTQMSNGNSSLQYMKNIRVLVDGVEYAKIPNFTAPYYDNLYYGGIPQSIPFKTGMTLDLLQGQSKTVMLVADVSNAPENFTTYIIGLGHVWDNGTGNGTPNGKPCLIYGNNDNVPFKGYPGGSIAIFLSAGAPADKGKSTPLSN